MKGFLKVKVANGSFVRINIDHIIYYEPFQRASHTVSSTRIYILDDCIETETNSNEIDEMIEEAVSL